MSVAVARPAQALRRRDAPRPTLAKRSTGMDGLSDGGPVGKKRKLNEPYVRDQQYILRKHKGKPASLTIHLHPTYFRFDGQDGSFAYDSPMRFVVSHLRKRTVPHEMMMELLENNVPFYDGCLIVEVHNHIPKEGKEKGRSDSVTGDGEVRFSMNNYNEHVTPSPLVEYPKKARTDATPEKGENSAGEMAAPERPKEKEGPRIATVVLEPTPLSQHHELLILANTPASEVRNKKRGSDGAAPSSAQPPTPSVSVPPTPISQTSKGPLTGSQKMCLEEGDFYSFQSDLLMATEPPLFLDPVDNPQDSQRVLDMLSHPLHQEKPPSPKTRKRTTAEVAADDAQAAETERMLLIMDDRIKPSAAGAAMNENQGAAAALGFSRFKTIEMVRQKIEEADRAKKEEEQRAAAEKNEEQQRKTQRDAREQKQREALLQQQQQQQQQPTQAQIMAMRQQQQQAMARAQAQQHVQMNSQNNHAHPSANNGMPNQHSQQQQNFPQASMTQSSPVVRQHTPMTNSSPSMNQNGFPMAQTSSQGAGSPQRPTSMPHPMVRQVSQQQQQQGSRHNTPQMVQPTPNMAQAMPNRQMTQTPRMPPGSPAAAMQQATPSSASMQMQMPTPHMNNQAQFSPEQLAMIQQSRQLQQAQQNNQLGGQAGSPAPSNMSPEHFQHIQRQHQQAQNHKAALMQIQAQLNTATAQGNQALAAQLHQRRQNLIMRGQEQMRQNQLQTQMLNNQMHGGGTPGGQQMQPQQTPQMGHGHPGQQQQQPQIQHQNQTPNMDQQQLTPQQQQANHAAAQARALQLQQMRQQQQQQHQQQIQSILGPILQQYGNVPANIPQHVIAGLPQPVQAYLKRMIQSQYQRQQQMRQQQQNGGGGGGMNGGGSGQETVPGGQPNPQYMQALRQNQAMLMGQMQNGQTPGGGGGGGGGGAGMNMGGMSFHMNGLGGQGQQ